MSIYTPKLVYYVYAYLREDGTPYYIGKGKNDRVFAKHDVKLPKNRYNIIFIEKNLTEIGALAIERKLIKWYGRQDLKTGILRNKTDGGDGTSGMTPWNKGKTGIFTKDLLYKFGSGNRGKKFSDAHRKKISESNKGKKTNLGKKHSEETKKKMSNTHKGKPSPLKGTKFTDEHKENLSKSTKGKPKDKIVCPHCNKIGGTGIMIRWHFDNCKQINNTIIKGFTNGRLQQSLPKPR